ncbi:hypothetical protein COW95_03855, partial [Candidatus Peregrinibacteria bacterium CG22_combo_CG10-13_8_21_14_all_49_11]
MEFPSEFEEIDSTDEGPLSPPDLRFIEEADLPVQELTPETRAKIVALFREYVHTDTYNSAAPTLELMKLWRQHPEQSLLELYDEFELDGVEIEKRYHGGNCFILAEEFVRRLRDEGIEAYVISDRDVTDT